jgi:hypothetical protein
MTRLIRYASHLALILAFIATGWSTASSQWRQKPSLQTQVRELRATVRAMAEHQRDLEARIAVLERLNLAPSPEILRQSYLNAGRDGMINEIANMAANAYQYRIRPTTMGGGGGSYVGYAIPTKLRKTEIGSYEVEVSADSVMFIGTSARANGGVRATVNKEGRTGGFVYTGEFE